MVATPITARQRLRIIHLLEVPEAAPTLARWFVEEWTPWYGPDGPGDAAVIRPLPGSRRGAVIGCGMNPRYGDFDTYHMAASAIDEAIRNCVAVGADPRRIAILDNFCWGYTDRPETLGSLVRAALACHDLADEEPWLRLEFEIEHTTSGHAATQPRHREAFFD